MLYQELKCGGFSEQVGNIILLKGDRALALQMLSIKFSVSHPILFINLTTFLVTQNNCSFSSHQGSNLSIALA